jgi:hypothetical protein
MKSIIFCLKSQIVAAELIEAQLREHVFRNIKTERLEISDDYNEYFYKTEHAYCRSFLNLFKASMIRVGRLWRRGGRWRREMVLHGRSLSQLTLSAGVVSQPHGIRFSCRRDRR